MQEWYIGSADLMDRNLDRRVEAVVPVEDTAARARIEEIVAVMLADDRHSWQLGADAQWRRTEVIDSREGTLGTFEVLRERALALGQVAVAPHRPGAGSGSLDPRA
jgi:polyphosphate kinase